MAADELLGGTVACEAGKQTVVMYDDAACTTQSSDQAWATSLAGYLSDDTYAVAYSCHKDGVLTSMKADSEYKPG